ncbi:hypothetical protein Dsin_007370 [Dipteronia sinensis]|uniref:HAT C-terminal dimerisation domain-containing protein n=1 Tax=Dipteronia sinensis TaxID=43782 RepID=A0AAE0B0Z8_9ROSI|nr:hypothetical protein Dsin_007370 [Dipteronia sinensis]
MTSRSKMQPADWWVMYGNCTSSLRAITIRILSQTASSSACERNWSTFVLIHTKQRNRLAYSKLEQLVYCYYNMKLKLRDMTAEKDKVDETYFMDLLQVAAEAGDDTENHFFDWIRPTYLDDDEGHTDPQIASHARDMRINVEQVSRSKVGVDREVTVSSFSDDHHTSNGNSGGKDDGDDGDERGGWDSGARGWDAGATCWNASAVDWDAHTSNFDQNRGRQHGGTSQIDEDSLNTTLSSMNMDTENSSLGDLQTMSGSHVPYYGSYGCCSIFDYPFPQMSYAIHMHADQQYPPS